MQSDTAFSNAAAATDNTTDTANRRRTNEPTRTVNELPRVLKIANILAPNDSLKFDAAEMARRLSIAKPLVVRLDGTEFGVPNSLYRVKSDWSPKESFSFHADDSCDKATGPFLKRLSEPDAPIEFHQRMYQLVQASRRYIALHYVTYHRNSYNGFFKPSANEIVAQLPKELFDSSVSGIDHFYFSVDLGPIYNFGGYNIPMHKPDSAQDVFVSFGVDHDWQKARILVYVPLSF
jgi:hypothetical protein